MHQNSRTKLDRPLIADSASPIFIVGSVRSGTTLMSSMLSAHPEIGIAPDLHYIYGWVQKGQHLDLSSQTDFERFWKAFSSNVRFGYLGIDPITVRQHIEDYQHYNFCGIYVSALSQYAAKLGKRRWGEKTPLSEGYLDTLFQWFPAAKVICMLRDPRGVVSSLRNTPWGKDISVQDHAQGWANGARRSIARKDDNRILCVRYESLVREPVNEAQRVCNFLGESFELEMVDGRDALASSVLKDRQGWEKEHISAALKPVHDKSITKWAHQLSQSEIKVIEDICLNEMQELDYNIINSND